MRWVQADRGKSCNLCRHLLQQTSEVFVPSSSSPSSGWVATVATIMKSKSCGSAGLSLAQREGNERLPGFICNT